MWLSQIRRSFHRFESELPSFRLPLWGRRQTHLQYQVFVECVEPEHPNLR